MGRRWGQHFLQDRSVVERILEAAAPGSEDRILEIGPGPGVLTRPLAQRAAQVLACEIDSQLADGLEHIERVTVVRGDFLKQDLSLLLEPPGWKVVANLPYYITTPILEKLLLEAHHRVTEMWLMMQKEVAQRIVSPASRQAGSLTYFVHLFADPSLLFTVPPGAFSPPPKVDSAVLHLKLHGRHLERVSSDYFQSLVRTAFGQRRKTLRRSLSGLLQDPSGLLIRAGVDPQRRPETLTMEEFLRLVEVWRSEGEVHGT